MKDAKDCITGLAVTQNQIIASSLDGGIRTYDLRAAKMVTDTLTRPVTHITLTKDGQCVVASCEDDAVRLVDTDTGDILQTFTGHKADGFRIECGVITNDTRVLSGSTTGAAFIWDLLEGNEVAKLMVGVKAVASLTTHPTKDEVMFAHRHEVQLWSKAT